MSRPSPIGISSDPIVIDIPASRPPRTPRHFQPTANRLLRSAPGLTTNTIAPAIPKVSRTSKTSQRHVVLPSEPQTQPLPDEVVIPATHAGRSEAERMSKEERQRSGYSRLTAYSVGESTRMKILAPFLKREHAVLPRVFDEAIYAVYHLPLLPGYAPNVNLRSSAPTHGKAILSRMSEAEEYGYEGTYFTETEDAPKFNDDGYISSSPHVNPRSSVGHRQRVSREQPEDHIGEVVFFSYGVAVFFGFTESQERDILDDLDGADVWMRMLPEDDWEIEECHYVYDSTVESPRIYNDFFTLRSRSHLLTLSVAHALAQSTLLAHYETLASRVLLNPATTQIPKELATTGSLQLTRGDALRLTGRLFKLRTDVNLVSNVLDVPELFWSEASLKGLYDAVREYLEIGPRVNVLNERLSVANDLLELIHDHVNSGAMDRITWVIIWLIVVACLVELGEVLARLVVHTGSSSAVATSITPEDALRAVQRLMVQES